jgi:hypothetical protein
MKGAQNILKIGGPDLASLLVTNKIAVTQENIRDLKSIAKIALKNCKSIGKVGRIECLAPAMACSCREPRRRAAVGPLSIHWGSSRCASGQPMWCSRRGSSDRDAASFCKRMLARRADRALQISRVMQTISMCEDSHPWGLEAHQFDTISGQTAPSVGPCSLADFVSGLADVRVD